MTKDAYGPCTSLALPFGPVVMLTYQARRSLPIVRFADLPIYLDASHPLRAPLCVSLPPSSPVTSGKKKESEPQSSDSFCRMGATIDPSPFFWVGREGLLSRVAFSITTPRFSTRKSCQLVSTSLPSESARRKHTRVPFVSYVYRSFALSPHSDVVPTSALLYCGQKKSWPMECKIQPRVRLFLARVCLYALCIWGTLG